MILNVNKPVGWTSADVVRKVKRLTGERKVGHGGTLDPFAEGVLVIGTEDDEAEKMIRECHGVLPVHTVRMKYSIVVSSAGKKSITISNSRKSTAILRFGKLR